MSRLTVAERILLHLSRFTQYENEYDVPVDISQDGISQALRISRAHAAVELKKLRESGEVMERLAHIHGGKARRKSYFLTHLGLERSRKLGEFAKKEGIDIMPLLDLRRCDPEQLWETFSPEQQEVFGQACVFRVPFPRDILPEIPQSILPLDDDDKVLLPENIRYAILEFLDDDQRREWESFAADHWLMQGDYQERLHHLLQAGRRREACMLVRDRRDLLLANADDDLNEILSLLTSVPEQFLLPVHELQARVSLEVGDRERTEAVLAAMEGKEDESYLLSLIRGEMHLMDGEYELALKSLREAEEKRGESDVRLGCLISQALGGLQRHDEGIELLKEMIERVKATGVSAGMDLIYYNMGLLLHRQGKSQDALPFLSKGIGMAGQGPRRDWHRLLSEVYSSMGLEKMAQEHARLSRD